MIDDINGEKNDALTAYLDRATRSGLLYSKIMTIGCILGGILYCSFGFILSNKDGSRRMIYDTWAPFDQQQTPFFELTCAFHIFVTGVCLFFHLATNNLCIQTLMFSVSLFNVLIERLSMIFENVERLYEVRQSSSAGKIRQRQLEADIDNGLRNLISSHIDVMIFLNRAAENLSYVLGTDFVCFTIILCTQMFTASLLDSFSQQMSIASLSGFSLTSTFLWNYHAELIRSKNESFCCRLYDVRWELADRKIQKAIQMMIARSQQPLGLSILLILPIGMDRVVQMMSTAYTYFTLLRTVYD
ncbi:odorant receptor Or2-like [Wyeomyia smithii]|uniref:odorant receptor Or2-like n=1 Tax=Wyeomyia smithii TaxID=174621 RepID=UPI002467EED5|nr:odorant receptor Or2-like [Wyeomyia smithii]